MSEIRGHVRLRKGIKEHINTGKMKGDMLSVFTFLLLWADYTCGIVWGTSAPYIGQKLRKPAKHINRQLLKLERELYIKRFGHRGQISSYEILIHKYLIFNEVLIDAVNTKDINHLAWSPGVNGEIFGNYKIIKGEINDYYLSPYKEIKNIIIKEKEQFEGEIFNFYGWKQDFKIYANYELTAYELLIKDNEFLSKLENQYPDLDILRTLEKTHLNYWASQKGFENKRDIPNTKIDWPAVYEFSCGLPFNQVLKGKIDDYAHPSFRKID